MGRKKLDKETKRIVDRGQALKDLVEGAGWKEARQRLISYVAAIRDITSLTSKDEKTLFQEVAGRQIAAEALLNWLKEIEGDAEQFKSNAGLIEETLQSDMIIRFEE